MNSYFESDCKYNDGIVRLKGMRNLGNTCYMNATLQALLSSNIINSRILRYTQDNPHEIREFRPILIEYVKLIYQLIDREDEGASSSARSKMDELRRQTILEPRDFKKAAALESDIFRGYGQQDSNELLFYMLNGFTEKPDESNNSNLYDGVRQILRDTYLGTYKQIITCSICDNKSETIQREHIILPYPTIDGDIRRPIRRPSSDPITLTDCFAAYSRREVQNDIHCEKCKKVTPSSMRRELDKIPEVAVITINRFEGLHQNLRKIDEPVEIFHKIELDGCPMRLIATINHAGSTPQSGHYTAYVSRSYYNPDNRLEEKWYMANDSSVSRIDIRSALCDPRIYMAIYERTS